MNEPAIPVPNYVILSGLILFIAGVAVELDLPMLAAPVLLLLPGYTMSTALYPGRDDLNSSERLIMSLSLNISIVSLLALAVNSQSLPLFGPGAPLLFALFSVTVIFVLISVLRRAGRIFAYDLLLSKATVSSVLLFLAILSVSAVILAKDIDQDKPTEFYLLDRNGTLNYSLSLEENEVGFVVLVVENHGPIENYTVETYLEEVLLNRQYLVLREDERWVDEVSYKAPYQNSTIRFTLYKDNEPIRRLHLLIRRR
jgi:uncharacterized membrane protein